MSVCKPMSLCESMVYPKLKEDLQEVDAARVEPGRWQHITTNERNDGTVIR